MIYNVKNKLRKLSHENNLMKKLYLLSNKIKMGLIRNVSDEKFAKMKYKENTGQLLNLENPVTYNEKLWWLKINNRDPLLTICSDKFKVRDYVEEKGLKHILTNIYGVHDNAEKVQFEKLPDKAFIKCTHGSGTNVLFDKTKRFDEKSFEKKFNYALKQNYYLQSREWNYKNIEPQLIIEEYLDIKDEKGLVDYRFLCFDGKVRLIFADIETADLDGSHNPYAKRNVYDENFNYLDITVGREKFDKDLLSKPLNFQKMVEYAEILSDPFVHCRVDFYNINGKIYFGEITFYPGGGTQKITPSEFDVQMGNWINIQSKKVNRI